MSSSSERRSFICLHLVLGIGLLVGSIQMLVHAMQELHGRHGHLALVATVEALGAVLFLWPRTLRVGGAMLLVVLLGMQAVHAFRGDWPLNFLTYAAATWYVMVHGPAWSQGSVDEEGIRS